MNIALMVLQIVNMDAVCKYGCGCWAGPFRSGGKVDPFGPCPNNPKEK